MRILQSALCEIHKTHTHEQAPCLNGRTDRLGRQTVARGIEEYWFSWVAGTGHSCLEQFIKFVLLPTRLFVLHTLFHVFWLFIRFVTFQYVFLSRITSFLLLVFTLPFPTMQCKRKFHYACFKTCSWCLHLYICAFKCTFPLCFAIEYIYLFRHSIDFHNKLHILRALLPVLRTLTHTRSQSDKPMFRFRIVSPFCSVSHWIRRCQTV